MWLSRNQNTNLRALLKFKPYDWLAQGIQHRISWDYSLRHIPLCMLESLFLCSNPVLILWLCARDFAIITSFNIMCWMSYACVMQRTAVNTIRRFATMVDNDGTRALMLSCASKLNQSRDVRFRFDSSENRFFFLKNRFFESILY